MSDEFDAVTARIRDRVEPDPAEREALDTAVERLVSRVEDAVADLPVETEIVLAGSTARDTWLAGDRDVDLFVCFPPDLDREQLESYGLQIGHEALPESHEEYAEHPYIVGDFEGFQVDLVPCYAVDDATDIQSAVDRTPFHTRYVAERLTLDLAGDVRVCKQLFEAIGVYGSDLRTKGFSGFLVELLVLEYGGFRPLVAAAADWQPPVRFDPEEHGQAAFDDPLVVIDPTDPERNVAAVLSAANLARIQHFARELLADPREELFEPASPEPLTPAGVRDGFEWRGTTPVAVRFEAPDVVEDQLWPQLDRSEAGIADELDRRGFDVFRSDAFAEDEGGENDAGDADGDAVLLFELAVAERPRVERHDGPPVGVREHAERFYEAYADDQSSFGPFVDGDRYVVEREREYATATEFLDSDAIFDVALGAHVETALADGYDLLVGDDVATLADTFGEDLARFLDPSVRGP
ncbi:CCA tRNA nucleotidyltransferase [Halobacteriales archaeon QH_2_66_30]|nr:MAG: CCA tRNA nucleotidyltransferase [Halobacteriales archaeon QH_2_66_30]